MGGRTERMVGSMYVCVCMVGGKDEKNGGSYVCLCVYGWGEGR